MSCGFWIAGIPDAVLEGHMLRFVDAQGQANQTEQGGYDTGLEMVSS